MTTLTSGGGPREVSQAGISSIVDTWILLETVESGGERNRFLSVLKSRGMAHSNRVRAFELTENGIRLGDAADGKRQVRKRPANAPRSAAESGGRRPRNRERARK